MKTKLILPKFKSQDDEFEFWSKLDLSEYYEAKDLKELNIDELFKQNKKSSNRRITMRLPEKLIDKVRQQARSLDVPYQSLMKMYIQQGAEK